MLRVNLQEARVERDEAREKLLELQSASQSAAQLQKDIEKERSQREDLQVRMLPLSYTLYPSLRKLLHDRVNMQGKLSKLEDENSKLASELSESQKAAKAAEQDVARWQSKAEKAEKNVEKAEKTLEKALQEHSATQSALIQARPFFSSTFCTHE